MSVNYSCLRKRSPTVRSRRVCVFCVLTTLLIYYGFVNLARRKKSEANEKWLPIPIDHRRIMNNRCSEPVPSLSPFAQTRSVSRRLLAARRQRSTPYHERHRSSWSTYPSSGTLKFDCFLCVRTCCFDEVLRLNHIEFDAINHFTLERESDACSEVNKASACTCV